MPEKAKAKLSIEERDLILEYADFVNPKFKEMLRKKRSRNGHVSIEIDEEDLKELIGCIAAEANHAKDRDVARALNALCDELESLEVDLY